MLNLKAIDFSYKLIEFDLDYLNGNPKELKKCLEKIEWQVSSNIQGPATILSLNNKRFVAIPSNRELQLEYAQANSISVPLKELPIVHTVRVGDPSKKELIHKMLDFEIRGHLQDKHQLWSLNTYQFYLKTPVFSSNDSDVDMFGGFVYRLTEDNGSYYISLNPTYKYASKYYLSELVNDRNVKDVIQFLKGSRCIYQNGDNWYQIEIRGFGKNISTHTFIDNDNNTHIVKNYILEKTKHHRFNVSALLKDEHLVLLYKYPYKDVKDFHGATSLAKQLFSTEQPEVKGLHKRAILEPSKRFEYINDNISRFFRNIEWNGSRLEIAKEPKEERLKYFKIPGLKYKGKDLIIKNWQNSDGSVQLGDFGNERKNWIKENQILTQSPFIPQYLIVPHFMNSNLAKAFQAHAEDYLKKLAPNFPGFTLLTYKSSQKASATEQVNEIAKELKAKNITRGNALFLLPFNNNTSNRKIKNFHDCLKKKFFPDIKFQCASLSKIDSYYSSFTGPGNLYQYKPKQETIDRYKSYLFNLMMEYLIINKKWPFALSENLNYDIYIGIDVHERYAGFCFFYKNGENIVFDYKEVPLIAGDKRKRAEKLKVDTIVSKVLEKLKEHIPLYAPNPNGIIIVRDGRSYGQEEIALKKVIEELHELKLVDKSVIKWGVLDLHKKNADPFRVAVKSQGYEKLENTAAGTYRIVDRVNGFIFNTGYPFKINGTANPIHVTLKDGNIDFEKALQDIFAQTILAFSAPDKPNSLPICLKLIDSFLAPIAANFQDIDDGIEEVEVIEDEEDK